MPEANMLPNVKGFKVFLICFYERQLPILQIQNFVFSVGTRPCISLFLHLPYVPTLFMKS